MEMSGWLMAPHHILDVWRFASVRPGALSVITCGELVMPVWCADSWDSPDSVRQLFWVIIAATRNPHSAFKMYAYLLATDATAQSGAAFGPGSGPISLTNVGCTGNEARLVDCLSSNITGSCTHSRDASATCVQNCKFCNWIKKIAYSINFVDNLV